jgi:hypothetical protein
MSLTVRSARSFYEWSQRTGPDDPSETNLPVFHRPSESGHMPAGGQVQMGPGNSVLLKSRAKQAARERSAKPSPALRSFKSNPRAAAVSSQCCGADLQVRAGSPEPAPVSSSSRSVFTVLWGGSPGPRGTSRPRSCCLCASRLETQPARTNQPRANRSALRTPPSQAGAPPASERPFRPESSPRHATMNAVKP